MTKSRAKSLKCKVGNKVLEWVSVRNNFLGYQLLSTFLVIKSFALSIVLSTGTSHRLVMAAIPIHLKITKAVGVNATSQTNIFHWFHFFNSRVHSLLQHIICALPLSITLCDT